MFEQATSERARQRETKENQGPLSHTLSHDFIQLILDHIHRIPLHPIPRAMSGAQRRIPVTPTNSHITRVPVETESLSLEAGHLL